MIVELGKVSKETKGVKGTGVFDPAMPTQPKNSLTFD